MIAWDSGDGLHQLAKTAAAAGLGLSAQHVRTVARWMAEFQLKLAQGGVITTGEHAGGPGPNVMTKLVERHAAEADGDVRSQDGGIQPALPDEVEMVDEHHAYTLPLD